MRVLSATYKMNKEHWLADCFSSVQRYRKQRNGNRKIFPVLLVEKPLLVSPTIRSKLDGPYAPTSDPLRKDAVEAEGITFKEFIKCSYSPGTSILLTF